MKRWIYWHIQNPAWYYWHRNLQPKLRGHKPFKGGIYLPLLSPESWAKRIHEMHFGQIVIGKLQFIINLTILLKVFDAPTWTYPIGLVTSAFLLWFVGYLMERAGIRKHFRQAEFNEVKIK